LAKTIEEEIKMSVNKVILIGNVGKKPEEKSISTGNSMAKFGLATNEVWLDKKTNQKNKRTDWHNITCFGKNAEYAAKYLSPGDLIYCEGKSITNKYQGKDGQTRYSHSIQVEKIQKLKNSVTPGKPVNQTSQNSQDFFDDDIPF